MDYILLSPIVYGMQISCPQLLWSHHASSIFLGSRNAKSFILNLCDNYVTHHKNDTKLSSTGSPIQSSWYQQLQLRHEIHSTEHPVGCGGLSLLLFCPLAVFPFSVSSRIFSPFRFLLMLSFCLPSLLLFLLPSLFILFAYHIRILITCDHSGLCDNSMSNWLVCPLWDLQ